MFVEGGRHVGHKVMYQWMESGPQRQEAAVLTKIYERPGVHNKTGLVAGLVAWCPQ